MPSSGHLPPPSIHEPTDIRPLPWLSQTSNPCKEFTRAGHVPCGRTSAPGHSPPGHLTQDISPGLDFSPRTSPRPVIPLFTRHLPLTPLPHPDINARIFASLISDLCPNLTYRHFVVVQLFAHPRPYKSPRIFTLPSGLSSQTFASRVDINPRIFICLLYTSDAADE